MKNLNTKTDGYFEVHQNGKHITDVYGKKIINGKPEICDCCGKTILNYFKTEYYDENDDGHFGTYGIDCFKGYVNFSVFTKFCKIILTDMKGVLEE